MITTDTDAMRTGSGVIPASVRVITIRMKTSITVKMMTRMGRSTLK